jgi:hypothetical protein
MHGTTVWVCARRACVRCDPPTFCPPHATHRGRRWSCTTMACLTVSGWDGVGLGWARWAVRGWPPWPQGMPRAHPGSTHTQHNTHTPTRTAVKQSKTIKRGDKLPLDDESLTLLQLSEGGEPQAVKLRDVVAGKKVVLFGLPGACALVACVRVRVCLWCAGCMACWAVNAPCSHGEQAPVTGPAWCVRVWSTMQVHTRASAAASTCRSTMSVRTSSRHRASTASCACP